MADITIVDMATTPAAVEAAANGFPGLTQSVLAQSALINETSREFSEFKGAISDYVTEQGTKNGWYYRYWASGIKECWIRGSKSGVDMTANHYSGYYYSDPIIIDLPFTFSSVQYVNVSGGSTSLINLLKELNTGGNSCSFWAYGLISTATNITVRYNIHVIGK